MFKSGKIVGVKELRQNLDEYINLVSKGVSFVVVRRSRPVFNIVPAQMDIECQWEEVADFTKIKRGGVKIEEVLKRL